jgi:uncharacterized membrane protein YtjA (UPF0391 family)
LEKPGTAAYIVVSPITSTSPLHAMLRWVLTFLVIALIAGVLGFTDIAGSAAYIAKVLFFVFLVLLVLSLLFGRRIWK